MQFKFTIPHITIQTKCLLKRASKVEEVEIKSDRLYLVGIGSDKYPPTREEISVIGDLFRQAGINNIILIPNSLHLQFHGWKRISDFEEQNNREEEYARQMAEARQCKRL